MSRLTLDRHLRSALSRAGKQSELARQANVSQAHISEVMNGKAPSPALLAFLGLDEVVTYKRKPVTRVPGKPREGVNA